MKTKKEDGIIPDNPNRCNNVSFFFLMFGIVPLFEANWDDAVSFLVLLFSF